jgi:uncharacterized membrane protein
MPAVMIRQLDGLTRIAILTDEPERRAVLLEQGQMIMRSAEDSVAERQDRTDVRHAFEQLRELGG